MASPALAVEREMVGNDNDGALMLGLICDRRAAWADCCSFCLGEEMKNWVNRLPLEVEGLRGADSLSPPGITTGVFVELANGFRMGFL